MESIENPLNNDLNDRDEDKYNEKNKYKKNDENKLSHEENRLSDFELNNIFNNQKEDYKGINLKDNKNNKIEEINERDKDINYNIKEKNFPNNNFNISNYNNKYISNFELTKNIGFSNIGHTCYMNSFLQILLHTPLFLPKLKEAYENKIGENTLINTIIQLSEYPNDTKYLYQIKKIMSKTNANYGTFIQYDTQIFAIDFIYTMIDEIKTEISESESSSHQEDNEINIDDKIIKENKLNKFISSCEKSGEKTVMEEFFSFIDYSIKYKNDFIDINKIIYNSLLNIELTFPSNSGKNSFSLYELLDNKYQNNNLNKKIIDENINININANNNNKNQSSSFFSIFGGFFYTLFSCCKKEEIQDDETDNEIQMTKANINKEINNNIINEAYKVKSLSKIVTLPNILIISFDRGIEGKPLISSSVSFDDALELKDYVDTDLFNINSGTTYKLYAINIRQGSTIHWGHCYSYVKVDNDWICFNDSYAHHENPNYSLDAVVGLYYIKNNLK